MSRPTYMLSDFASKMMALLAALDAALNRGVAKALTLTNRQAIANLSGSRQAEPWTYPVPVRTPAGLRGNQSMQQVSPASGYVLNTAAYAGAISSGEVSEWAGRGRHRMAQRVARPFIDDAADTVQPLMVIQTEVEEALPSWA